MKKIGILFLSILMLLPSGIKASTIAVDNLVTDSLATNAKSAILIEEETGKILYEKNAHEKLAPASMTKIMSMLIIIEAIEKGTISWDEMITVSERASSMGGSQILLETGEQMTVSDLFKGVAVASGNDAVVALAEAVAGTVEEFVVLMNDKVKELGLNDTNFKNPHGLDDANHYSSAYDMVFIARELVKHEKVLEFTSIYEDYLRKGTSREFWLTNTNKLTRFKAGVDGLKTGYTKEAGYCLTATMKKDNMRLVSTVMGEETSTVRNAEISALLDYGYAKYKMYEVVEKKKIITDKEIEKGNKKYVDIVTRDSYSIVTEKNNKLGEITYDVELNEISAPINKGEVVGKLIIKSDNSKIGEVELTVNDDVKKANLFELYFRYLNDIISGKMSF